MYMSLTYEGSMYIEINLSMISLRNTNYIETTIKPQRPLQYEDLLYSVFNSFLHIST